MTELILGVGTRSGAPVDELVALADGLVEGLEDELVDGPADGDGVVPRDAVVAVVTSTRKRTEPAVVELARRLGVPLQTYDDETLASQPVAAPSEVVRRQALDLPEHVLGAVDVELAERSGAEGPVGPEDLEQVELDVAQVALVVAHGGTCSSWSGDRTDE